jgi:HEAT repeat protein
MTRKVFTLLSLCVVSFHVLGQGTEIEGHSREEILILLASKKSGERAWACLILQRAGANGAFATVALSKAINDKSEYVRKAAFMALAAIGPDASESISAVTEFLVNSKANEEIVLALNAIRSFGATAANSKEVLLSALKHKDPRIRIAGSLAIWAVTANPDVCVANLVSMFDDKAADVRLAALDAMKQLGSNASGAIEAIEKLTSDKRDKVRAAAIRVLSALKNPSD